MRHDDAVPWFFEGGSRGRLASRPLANAHCACRSRLDTIKPCPAQRDKLAAPIYTRRGVAREVNRDEPAIYPMRAPSPCRCRACPFAALAPIGNAVPDGAAPLRGDPHVGG